MPIPSPYPDPRTQTPRVLLFGPFSVDIRTGELRKHGIKIKLRHQTFQILLMLLENPGEVVLREEIREKLWPNDTVVEFDHSINAAIQKLRDALGETAADSRYIETLTRRGYRFLGTVTAETAKPAPEPQKAAEEETATANPKTPEPARSAYRFVWMPVAAAACLVILLGWFRPWEQRELVRNLILPLETPGFATLSPDGSAIAYVKERRLFMRRMDSLAEISLFSSEPLIDNPIWSPDGLEIAFPTINSMMRMRVPDGPAVKVTATLGPPRGATWSSSGELLQAVAKSGRSDLYVVPTAGGDQTRIEVPGLAGGRFYQPQFLPNGEDFVFAWAAEEDPEAGLYLATLRNRTITRGPFLLRKNRTAGLFSSSGGGRLLYVEANRLYAQRVNIRLGKLEGEPKQVVEEVRSLPENRIAHFSISENGVLVWRTGAVSLAQMTWFDRKGNVLGTAGPPCNPNVVILSPDERHILFLTHDGQQAVASADQNGYVRLAGARGARWAPASSNIVYRTRSEGKLWLWDRPAGGGAEKRLVQMPESGGLRDVSPDGRTLLFPSLLWSLHAIQINGKSESPTPKKVIHSEERIGPAHFSPDGRWIVYSTLGNRAVSVRPFEFDGPPTQIGDGFSPVWRADGKEILYVLGKKIYSVRIEAMSREFRGSQPEPLFDVRPTEGLVGSGEPLAVTRDGSRILYAQAIEQPEARNYVMTAWDRKLKH